MAKVDRKASSHGHAGRGPTTDPAFSAYMRDLADYPPLDHKELDEVLSRIRSGDRIAVNRLVETHLRFAVKVAAEFHPNSVLSMSDLVAEGNLGLMEAAKRFDPDKGFRFSTYAVWWIKQSIRRAVYSASHPVRLPTSRTGDLDQIRRRIEQLSQQLGEAASLEAVAADLGMRSRRVVAALETKVRPISLEAPIYEEGDRMPADVIADSGVLPDMEIVLKESVERVRAAVGSLGDRDAEVIALLYGEEDGPMTLQEVGEHMGISRERVRQLRDRALRRLRQQLGPAQDRLGAD